MKKLLLASAMVVFASSAMAGNLYISPKFGFSYEKTNDISGSLGLFGSDKDNVFHAGFAVGYDMSKFAGVNLRAEGEYMFHAKADAKVSGAEMGTTVHSLNANLYYDFKNTSQWTPYVGAGLGISLVDTKFSYYTLSLSDKDYKFTYNLQAGIDFSFDDHNTIGAGYRYSSLGDGEATNDFGGVMKAKHPAHEFTLTYRYTF